MYSSLMLIEPDVVRLYVLAAETNPVLRVTDPLVLKSSCVLSVCGWQVCQTSCSKTLECTFCNRKIGLWNYFNLSGEEEDETGARSWYDSDICDMESDDASSFICDMESDNASSFIIPRILRKAEVKMDEVGETLLTLSSTVASVAPASDPETDTIAMDDCEKLLKLDETEIEIIKNEGQKDGQTETNQPLAAKDIRQKHDVSTVVAEVQLGAADLPDFCLTSVDLNFQLDLEGASLEFPSIPVAVSCTFGCEEELSDEKAGDVDGKEKQMNREGNIAKNDDSCQDLDIECDVRHLMEFENQQTTAKCTSPEIVPIENPVSRADNMPNNSEMAENETNEKVERTGLDASSDGCCQVSDFQECFRVMNDCNELSEGLVEENETGNGEMVCSEEIGGKSDADGENSLLTSADEISSGNVVLSKTTLLASSESCCDNPAAAADGDADQINNRILVEKEGEEKDKCHSSEYDPTVSSDVMTVSPKQPPDELNRPDITDQTPAQMINNQTTTDLVSTDEGQNQEESSSEVICGGGSVKRRPSHDGLPSSVVKRRRLKKPVKVAFDPIAEHHPWCSWVHDPIIEDSWVMAKMEAAADDVHPWIRLFHFLLPSNKLTMDKHIPMMRGMV